MKRHMMAVGSRDEAYVRNLIRFAERRLPGFPFDIHGFSDPADLKRFLAERQVSLTLLSEGWLDGSGSFDGADGSGEKTGVFIVLRDDPSRAIKTELPAVTPYQALSSLLRSLLDIYSRQAAEEGGSRKEEVILTGFYSPWGERASSALSLACASELARQSTVLYLDLSVFSPLSHLLSEGPEQDLSDLLLLSEKGDRDFEACLSLISRSCGRVTYIPPAANDRDIFETEKESWLLLFDRIRERTAFDRIVCDFGQGIQGLFPLLSLCDSCYLPYAADRAGRYACEAFLKAAEAEGRTELLSRIRKIEVPLSFRPFESERSLENLTEGPAGELIREALASSGRDGGKRL